MIYRILKVETNEGVWSTESVLDARAFAERCWKQSGEHHVVEKAEQIWSTQTLEQSIANANERRASRL